MRSMVNQVASHKKQKRPRQEQLRIRAGLIMIGHTAKSFAKANGVSTCLVSRLITGHRPGRSGRSAALNRKLAQLAAKLDQLAA